MISEPQSNPSQMSQTAVVIGAVVGTVSILFVCCWLLYCYKKHQNEREPNGDRNYHGRTPNQSGKILQENIKINAVRKQVREGVFSQPKKSIDIFLIFSTKTYGVGTH